MQRSSRRCSTTAIDAAPPTDAAAPAIDAAGDDPREAVREKMADFAENHEYLAILQIADLAPNDPVAQQLVADAKDKYVAEQAEAIAGQVRIGACKKAKELAAAAQKNVPDDTTLAARAAACKPLIETAPETTATIMKKAGDAFGKQDYATALALAQKVLDKAASNEGALRLAALSSCSLHDAKQARVYYLQLNQADRTYAQSWCSKENIVPTGEPEAPSGPPHEVKATIAKAGAALAQGDDKTAAALANQALKAAPRNGAALTIVGHRRRASTATRRPPSRCCAGCRRASRGRCAARASATACRSPSDVQHVADAARDELDRDRREEQAHDALERAQHRLRAGTSRRSSRCASAPMRRGT